MKINENKENPKWNKYTPEDGDVMVCTREKPINLKDLPGSNLKFDKRVMSVQWDNQDISITLSPSQFDRLVQESEKGSLEGRTIKARSYENKTYGKTFIALDVVGENNPKYQSNTQSNDIDYENKDIQRKYILACKKNNIKPTVLAYTGKRVQMNTPKDEWKQYKDDFNKLVKEIETEQELGADSNDKADKEPSNDMKKAMETKPDCLQKDILNMISIKTHDKTEGIMHDDLVKELEKQYTVKEDVLNEDLRYMAENGMIFETKPGYYKVLE